MSSFTLRRTVVRVFNLLFILAFVLATASLHAASAEVYLTYDFPNIVWQETEKQGFAIFDRGEEIGEVNVWIKQIEYFDQTAYMIEYIEDSGEYQERTVTKVAGLGLKPLAVTKRIEVGEDVWYYEANYTSEELVMSYTTPDDPFKKRMSMTGGIDFYAAEALPYMLRNLQFAEDDMYTLTLLGVETMHLQSAIIEVTGEEIVEVPSGIYDCWKVEIRMGGITYEAWYSKKQPQFLIKYYFGKEMGMKNHT
jgi:hypothetical protein